MRASISTSRAHAAILALWLALTALPARAADPVTSASPSGATEKAEEDDFAETPFTEFGEFNEAEEEVHNIEFFQFGRFFGISAGAGIHDVIGNRGLLWKGGFPMITVKMHAWFDLKVGVQLFFATVSHNFQAPPTTENTDVSVFQFGVDFKYYLGTRDVTAAIAFANPYLLIGGGSFAKNEFDATQETLTPDSTFGLDFGFGLEFAISPRRSYFTLEAKGYVVSYADTNSQVFSGNGVPDLTGMFYSLTGSIMFTW
ncbi:MAG: hypothetical protein IT285_07400 [Bdellovibrionales bacterium]|nr:hypothetical protein [Bdellovibrionales bacterium]